MQRASTHPVLLPIKSAINPAYLLIPVFLGLFIGLGFGLKDRIAGNRIDRDENYIVLAATVYGQNPSQEVAADLRQRLIGLGINNPSSTVLTLADTYATSRDRDVQLQADGLRLFGEALSGVTTIVKVPAAILTPTASPYVAIPPLATARLTPSPSATVTAPPATPTSAGQALAIPTVSPSPTTTDEVSPTATVTSVTATPTAKKATSTATRTAAPSIRSATVSTGTKQNVLVRAGPATNQPVLVTLANGSKVDVVKSVTGEVIINGSSRWYLVNCRNSSGKVIQGYVYGLLVTFTS